MTIPENDYSRINVPSWRQSPALVFDIDGTLLKEGEALDTAEPYGNNYNEVHALTGESKLVLADTIKELVDYGYRIVFITGNDFNKQKPRVLDPILHRDLGESVLCFSDGGSRVFYYDSRSRKYRENIEYSKANQINPDSKDWIVQQFHDAIGDFVKKNPTLCRPEIDLHDRTLDYSELIIYPLRPSFFRGSLFRQFTREVKKKIKESHIVSPFQLMETIPNALIIRLNGDYAEQDSHRLQNRLHDIFDLEDFRHISRPEAEVRGGNEYISQIALKPFKLDHLRRMFMEIIQERFRESPFADEFSILLGGRTTIDIQVKGVDKKKALTFLLEQWQLDPRRITYFGDEFLPLGNDLTVAQMPQAQRPALIIHVGDLRSTPRELILSKGFLTDGNGPRGTANYLEFLLNEIRIRLQGGRV